MPCASVLVRGGGTLAGGWVHVPLATLLLNCEDGLFPLPFWAVDQRGLAIPISILAVNLLLLTTISFTLSPSCLSLI